MLWDLCPSAGSLKSCCNRPGRARTLAMSSSFCLQLLQTRTCTGLQQYRHLMIGVHQVRDKSL